MFRTCFSQLCCGSVPATGRLLPAGQLLPAGFMTDPLGIFPKRVSQLYVCMFRSADFLLLGLRFALV